MSRILVLRQPATGLMRLWQIVKGRVLLEKIWNVHRESKWVSIPAQCMLCWLVFSLSIFLSLSHLLGFCLLMYQRSKSGVTVAFRATAPANQSDWTWPITGMAGKAGGMERCIFSQALCNSIVEKHSQVNNIQTCRAAYQAGCSQNWEGERCLMGRQGERFGPASIVNQSPAGPRVS